MSRGDPFDTRGYDAASDVLVSATVGIGSVMPVARSIDVKGGTMQVVDLATRDAIPDPAAARDAINQFRQEGMTVFVQATQRTYQLQGGITNADWVDVTAPANVGSKSRVTNEPAVAIGEILSQSPTVAQRVEKASPATNDALSRPVGVATSAQPASGNPVDLQTVQGEPVPVLMVAGLTLAGQLGNEVILSTTAGSGTLPGASGAPPSGQWVQRVGILLDPLTYDGAADLLVLVQLDFSGTRRQET